MAKKIRKRKQVASTNEGTNWVVIGGIGGLAILFLAAMMYLAVKPPSAPKDVSLQEHCQENEDACISMGDENAPVTMVEISDFGCPHCRNFNRDKAPILKLQYVDTGIVNYVSVPYALGPTTLLPANAAMCANEQDAYFEYQTALFVNADDASYFTLENMVETAVEIGLDGDALDACMKSGKYTSIIQENIDIAREAGVTGTPAFFINGEKVDGNVSLEIFADAIARAEKRQQQDG